jgi:three-Cys-motif partner protein
VVTVAKGQSDITDIGPWSEVKLRIVREYAGAYSRILSAQAKPALTHVYVDAFSGAGVHSSRTSGNLVEGSPAVALETRPPFAEYHFIDLKKGNIDILTGLVMSGSAGAVDPSTVHFYNADCNTVLLESVFPRIRFSEYRRGLCLLDPYGLHLDWEVVRTAGQMGSMEIFLNFPIYDMNLNVLRHDPSRVDPAQAARMTRFWGDDSWRDAAYSVTGNLFGYPEKQTNEVLVRAYQKRLKKVAGFKHVPDPIPMRNSINATVYYLFFASQKPAAGHIIEDIFSKYRT